MSGEPVSTGGLLAWMALNIKWVVGTGMALIVAFGKLFYDYVMLRRDVKDLGTKLDRIEGKVDRNSAEHAEVKEKLVELETKLDERTKDS